MKRIISALALLATAGLGVAGCGGDDDDDASNAGGSSGTASVPNGGEPASNGGEPNAAGGVPATGNVQCDPAEDGVCQNDQDCPFVVDGSARITAGTCGKGCLASSDESCARDCLLEELDMSAACAQCYLDTVNCTVTNCLAECVNDPEADECKQCQIDKGCRADFNACSGLPE